MKRINQRGYNLLEIAIVLTVFLMMSSWLGANYYSTQKDQRVAETERTIEIIKQAIVEYAGNNTIKSFVAINGVATTVTVRWRMPVGRPYLPCPDITGDGFEDRLPLTTVPASTVEIILSDGSYNAERVSDCYRHKGLVPWRTLNTPPADGWGNYFTYRVDPDFAYSLLGFDQETTSDDSHDRGDLLPPLQLTTSTSGQQIAVRSKSAVADENISVATTGNADVAGIWGSSIDSLLSPSIICLSSPCSYKTQSTLIVAGAIAPIEMTVQSGGYAFEGPVYTHYEAESIIQGVPVVILSHGENRYGGVIHGIDGVIDCVAMPALAHEDELQNAYWTSAITGCPEIRPLDTNARQNGFVVKNRAHPLSDAGEFDDIVGWLGIEELAAKLTKAGTFPVDKLPPVGLDEY